MLPKSWYQIELKAKGPGAIVTQKRLPVTPALNIARYAPQVDTFEVECASVWSLGGINMASLTDGEISQ